jgi:hypothetical protein
MKSILVLTLVFLCSCSKESDDEKFENELLAHLQGNHSKMSVLYWIVSEEKIKAVEETLLLEDPLIISGLLPLIGVKESVSITIGVSGDILIDGSNPMSFVFPDKIHAQVGEDKKMVYALKLLDDSFYRELSVHCLADSLDKGYSVNESNITLWIGSVKKEIEKGDRKRR